MDYFFFLSLFVNLLPHGRTWGRAPDELYFSYYYFFSFEGWDAQATAYMAYAFMV